MRPLARVNQMLGDRRQQCRLAERGLPDQRPNEVAPGKYLTVDYSAPGQILVFDRSGRTLWRYRPTGAAALDHPSLALPLPNGDVLATDDHHDRVIVVDPRTNQVVWQYGHIGVPGSGPGYLNGPDGADLSGSASLLAQFAPALSAAVAKAPLPATRSRAAGAGGETD